MRSVDNESFQQNSSDLLLNGFGIGLGEQIEKSATEVMGVRIGVTQLIGDRVQEEVST